MFALRNAARPSIRLVTHVLSYAYILPYDEPRKSLNGHFLLACRVLDLTLFLFVHLICPILIYSFLST